MPQSLAEAREQLEEAIENNNVPALLDFLPHVSKNERAKELLLMDSQFITSGAPFFEAIFRNLPPSSLRIFTECARANGVLREVLEHSDRQQDWNVILFTTMHNRTGTPDILHFLLQVCADFFPQQVLGEMLTNYSQDNINSLHPLSYHQNSLDSFVVLISFFPSNKLFQEALTLKNRASEHTPAEELRSRKQNYTAQFISHPECWRRSHLMYREYFGRFPSTIRRTNLKMEDSSCWCVIQ